jgi:hypothetical protein
MMARSSHAVAHGRRAEHRVAVSGMSGMVLAFLLLGEEGREKAMRTATVFSLAFLLVHCSSSGNPAEKSSSPVVAQRAMDSGIADASCVAPASADTFDADSGIGCRPSLDCYPQADGGEMCGSGCRASQYELLCTGVGPSFAPHPADALNCRSEGLPGQTANLLHYCCACPSN